MVVTIDGKVTINFKFCATGPWTRIVGYRIEKLQKELIFLDKPNRRAQWEIEKKGLATAFLIFQGTVVWCIRLVIFF